MAISVTWTPSVGSAVTIPTTNTFVLHDISGLGGAPQNTRITGAPYQHGGTLVDTRLNPRMIRLQVKVLATTEAGVATARRTLVSAFNARLGIGTLDVTYPAGTTYRIIAQPIETPDFPTMRAPLIHPVTIELLAPHPDFYIATESTTNLVNSGSTGSLSNTGDVPSPITATFYGPVTDPILTVAASGDFLGLDAVLAAGEKIIVICGPGAPTATFSSSADTGSDGMQFVLRTSTFLELATSANGLTYTKSASTGTVGIAWRRWIAGL
jgi:hypothetical protein